MRDDEYGLLPPEYDASCDEFNTRVRKPDVKAAKEEARKKKKKKNLMLKMVLGTITTVTIFSTTPAWENVAGSDNTQIIQDDTSGKTSDANSDITSGISEDGNLSGITKQNGGTTGISASAEETVAKDNKNSKDNIKTGSNTLSSGSETDEDEPASEDDDLLYCGDCYGTGFCSTCHNNGYIQCDNLSNGCSLCLGSGVRTCPGCGGSGACASCGGSGEGSDLNARYSLCSNCNGKGILCGGSAAADDPDGCNGNVVSNCMACSNTGMKADGSPCSWCKGTLRHLCPSFEVHRNCTECNGSGVVLLND